MAVIFAIGGVIVVGVIAHTDYSDYSDYYSNYGNYSNYSDYSDAAERRRRRIASKQAEVDQALSEMRDYKRNELNPYLHDDSLKRKDAKDISIAAMERDFSEHHKNVEKEQVAIRSQQLRQELNEIDTLLNRLDSIIKKDD